MPTQRIQQGIRIEDAGGQSHPPPDPPLPDIFDCVFGIFSKKLKAVLTDLKDNYDVTVTR